MWHGRPLSFCTAPRRATGWVVSLELDARADARDGDVFGRGARDIGLVHAVDAVELCAEALDLLHHSDVDGAFEWALSLGGPALLAVDIDPGEVFPPLRTKIEQRKIDLMGQ